LNLLKDTINLGKRKVKVVVDCGNGTGSIIIKDILDQLNIEYYPLYCDSDPRFPNHHPDPEDPNNMIDLGKKVVELGYDFGFSVDGDADRVGIVDSKGNYVRSHLVMLIIYRALAPIIKNKKAIYDVKTSRTLIDALDDLGFNHKMHRIGNSYFNKTINEEKYEFAGECSGHFFFRNLFMGFDDGIYAGLRIIEIMSNTDGNIEDLLDNINKYYATDEIKVKTTDQKKFEIVEYVKKYCDDQGYKYIDIDGIRVEFDDSWALIRASNTGPTLGLRFEANTEERLEKIKNEFLELVNNLK